MAPRVALAKRLKGYMPKQSEASLHRAVAHYLRLALPPEVVWWHTPNSGKRTDSEAGQLKAFGMLAGVPDLAFIFPGGLVRFLELKTMTGSLEPEQAVFLRRVGALGCPWAVCRTLEAVEAQLAVWAHETGVSLKAHLTAGGTVRITRPDAPLFAGAEA